MPLTQSSSPSAFSHNVAAEIDAGKPKRQALAISYAVKRKNRANGGAVNTQPSDRQKEAGNYKKGHVTFQGLPVTIENPKGSMRSGVGRDGYPWSVKMPDHYGYIKRTTGADGDHVDVYIGPNARSQHVFLVDQVDEKTKRFDEHKALLGYDSKDAALSAYRKAFSDGKGNARIGACTELSLDAFKAWLKGNGGKKPFASTVRGYATGGEVTEDSITAQFARDAASDRLRRMVKHRAAGGPAPAPWFTRNEARAMTGPLHSKVPGRTDHLPINVPGGAYVLPADHVSGMGQGNTQAGLAILSNMFSSGPYGSAVPKMGGRGRKRKFADGGDVPQADVPIMAAGGEFVIPPEIVAEIGGGDMDHGHKVLDKWVVDTRKNLVKELKKLPGPSR